LKREDEKEEEMSAEVPAFDADAFKLDIMNSVATLIQAEVEKFAKNDKVSDIEKARKHRQRKCLTLSTKEQTTLKSLKRCERLLLKNKPKNIFKKWDFHHHH
jgi:hypothetical protein